MSPKAKDLSLSPRAVNLVIDMQRVFAEDTAWRIDDFASIVRPVSRLAAHCPARTLFTSFRTPDTPEAAHGHWSTYYRRWSMVTLAQMDSAMLDLIPALRAFQAPDRVIGKRGYSAFEGAALETALERLGAEDLIVCGVETDVCVLATIFSAIDRGHRVIVPADAVASASREAHEATLGRLLPRIHPQVELSDSETVLTAWS